MQFDIRLKKYIDKKVDKNWKLSKDGTLVTLPVGTDEIIFGTIE